MTDVPRPSPEALLREADLAHRGRLKLFVGAAPGVGKTYAMLGAARERLRAGDDVVIGIVETHGRADTAAQLEGFEQLPRRLIHHQGRVFDELDLDALLERRPSLALIDEIAHSNVPGCRHLKRYQDVDELLAAGIDVFGTLNVQHIESLHDTIERITGVSVRERVPDRWFEGTDEIELIDLPPETLIQRLHDGKVYPGQQAQRAVDGFFGVGNLTALRDLVLRKVAEHVDSDVTAYLERHPADTAWSTSTRLMVCIGGETACDGLVRSAARAAQSRRLRWIAVHVVNSQASRRSDVVKDRVSSALRLAEQLGGEAVTIPGEDVAEELIRFARERNVAQLLVAASRRPLWLQWLRRSTLARLLGRDTGLDLTLVHPGPGREPDVRQSTALKTALPSVEVLTQCLGMLVLATTVGAVAERFLPLANLSLLYLVAVLAAAIRHGRTAAYLMAVASFACFNLLFTEPRFHFAMHLRDQAVTLVFFLIVAMLAGGMASTVRSQLDALRRTARRTANLNEFSRRVARAASEEQIATAIAEHLNATLGCSVALLLQHPENGIRPIARVGLSPDFQFHETEQAAATWCWQQRKPSGATTSTLPTSRLLFMPLSTATGIAGVVGLLLPGPEPRTLSAGRRRLLEALCDQAAVALERIQLSHELASSQVSAQTEQLRAALLSSVSHDLRTPLASIIGSASTLTDYDALLSSGQRGELARTIGEEARRLDHHVQNLLDITRLTQSGMRPALEWCDLHDIYVAARESTLRAFPALKIHWSDNISLPPLRGDAALLRQLLINLFENAARHASVDAEVEVQVRLLSANEMRVRVIDNGPGLPQQLREQLFDLMAKARGRDHRRSGSGLGLVICRSIVQLHGGRIGTPNLPGRGACIEFVLPRLGPAGK